MYDVVIVGAGLSGLRLAALLQAQGSHYLLLDARARLGGRIVSQPVHPSSSQSQAQSQAQSNPHRYDLGPSWIWPHQPRINQLTQQLGIKHYPQYDQGTLVYQDQQGAINSTIDAAPMAGSLRVEGGLQSVIDGIACELEPDRLWLNHTVQSLTHENQNHENQRVRLDCLSTSSSPTSTASKQLTIYARKVVLAVPPRVIASTITFVPALLPTQTQALTNMPTWMAGQCKVTAVYATPFWRAQGLSGDAMSHIGPLSEIHDASAQNESQGALFGFVGLSAQQRQSLGEELTPHVINQLQQLFGPKAAKPLQVIVQDWAMQPFTATPEDSLALSRQPTFGLPQALEQVWQGSVLFSSAEMAMEFGGLVEGALEAAEAAFDQLNPKI